MVETLIALILLACSIVYHDPLYSIAAGLFAIAVNIGNLRRPEYHETDQH